MLTTHLLILVPSLIFSSVKSQTCQVYNHHYGRKLINLYSKNQPNTIWVNLTLDDIGDRDNSESFHFQVKFDNTNPKPVLESVKLNQNVLCLSGGNPHATATTLQLATKIPTFHNELRPVESPIRDDPQNGWSSGINIKPSAANCGIKFEGPTDYFYWKPYSGKVPKDAILAAVNKGKNVYIGSGLFGAPQGVLPGPTYENDKSTYSAAFSRQVDTALNVKILCSPQAEKLTWKKVHIDEIYKIPECHFIEGGYEFSYPGPLLIGRIKVDDEYVIGKVIIVNEDYKGLEAFHRGKHYFKVPEFEVIGVCN